MTTDWIMTASGRRFWPLEPRVEDVCIEDIAHHLAHLCRFTGAVRTLYTVAQHSILASRCLVDAVANQIGFPADDSRILAVAGLYGLLHDASEAYLMDIPRPLKRSSTFAAYRAVERNVQATIYTAFGLRLYEEPSALKVIDRRLLRTEQRDLMPPAGPGEDRHDVASYSSTIVPQQPAIAREAFLYRFHTLRKSIVTADAAQVAS